MASGETAGPLLGDRRRGLGQDQRPGAPRGASRRARRRPRGDPAADLLAARGGGNGPARGAHRAPGRRGPSATRGSEARLGGHLPQHRRAPAARIRVAHRPQPGFHHPRSRGLRRPVEPGAARTRPRRHRQALSAQEHLPRHLLRRGQHARPAGRCPAAPLSLVHRMGRPVEAPVPRLRRGEAGAARARLRRPAVVLGTDGGGGRAGRRDRRALQSCSGGRIPGHQRAAGEHRARAQARRPRRDGGRRRRAVDLRVSRRDGAQHSRLSRAVHAPRPHRHAGAQLPFHAADPRRRERRDQPRQRGLRQVAVERARVGRAAAAGERARRERPGRVRGARKCWRGARPASPSRHRRCCSARRTTARRWKSN